MSDDWQRSEILTGTGSTNGTRSSCSAFYWHSDSSIVSSSVSIRWQGSFSHLASHRHWFDVDEDVFVLTDRDDSGVTIIVIAIAVSVVVGAILLIVICCCCRRRRKQAQLQEELLDIPPVQPIESPIAYGTPTLAPAPPRPPALELPFVAYPTPGPAPVAVPQGTVYQAPAQIPQAAAYQAPVAVPQGAVYQQPQFVQVPGGCVPVYFQGGAYPYGPTCQVLQQQQPVARPGPQ
jgi:hypothetical protein